jgi:hypothetical protein
MSAERKAPLTDEWLDYLSWLIYVAGSPEATTGRRITPQEQARLFDKAFLKYRG